MKFLSFLFTLFCFSFLNAPVAMATGQLKISPEEVQIVRAEFGLFSSSGFVPSDSVPLVEGQAYGWRIELKTNKAKIKWREQFILPAAPVSWGEAETQGMSRISGDKRVSVMEREVSPVDGVIFNSWIVVEGDPKGRYMMRVLIDNRYERVFTFDVQPKSRHQSD